MLEIAGRLHADVLHEKAGHHLGLKARIYKYGSRGHKVSYSEERSLFMASEQILNGKRQMESVWLGIDVAKQVQEAALWLPENAASGKCPSHRFNMSDQGVQSLLQWADEFQSGADVNIIMEATGKYSTQLAAILHKARPGCPVSIVNPAYIKFFGQSLGSRNKTDKADARIIARYGHERQPAPYQVPSQDQAHLCELSRERGWLVEQRTAESNHGSDDALVSKLTAKLRSKRLELLENQIQHLDKEIQTAISAQPSFKQDYDLFTSIPGVGPVTASLVLAELGDIRRFDTGRKLAAYVGLTPRENQSGNGRKRTRLCRMGNTHVRTVLHMGVRSILHQEEHPIAIFYRKLVSAGKPKKSAISAGARKLIIMMRAIAIAKKPYDAHFTKTQGCGKPVEKSVERLEQQLETFNKSHGI